MARPILVIIDPQNDFTHLEGSYARRHEGITQILETKYNISRLVNQSFNVQKAIVRSDYKPGQFGAELSMCIPGTFGHQIDADLLTDSTCTVVTKTEHSCFSSEAFKNLLHTAKIDTLILCGFLAEYCVKKTAADALSLGFRVFLVEDCIATGDDVQHRKQQALTELKQQGAAVVRSQELHAASQQNSN